MSRPTATDSHDPRAAPPPVQTNQKLAKRGNLMTAAAPGPSTLIEKLARSNASESPTGSCTPGQPAASGYIRGGRRSRARGRKMSSLRPGWASGPPDMFSQLSTSPPRAAARERRPRPARPSLMKTTTEDGQLGILSATIRRGLIFPQSASGINSRTSH